MTRTIALPLLIVGQLVGCGVKTDVSGGRPSRSVDAIIGGTTETGWQGVGALVYYVPGWAYGGSFCSGTLVDPRWVLTAAHCVTGDGGGGAQQPPTVSETWFFVGNDANDPSSGDLYPAVSFHPHPNYDPQPTDYDIALVRLASPAIGVPTYPYNTTTFGMPQTYVNADAFYVGFGINDGVSSTGGGVKRSTSLQILVIDPREYMSDNGGPAICFGDSGGPGFLNISGVWRVVGVNSTVSGNNCIGYANHTRVDYYAGWISNEVAGAPSNCNMAPSLCRCPTACQANGTCNNTACETLACYEIYYCVAACGSSSSCFNDCYNQGTAVARAQFDAWNLCSSQCTAETDACFNVVGTGTDSCDQIYDCLVPCTDGACWTNCMSNGTAQGTVQVNAMLDCWDAFCGTLTGTAHTTCIYANCENQMRGCFGIGSEGDNCGSNIDCDFGLTCKGVLSTSRCKVDCNPTAPSCPNPGQLCDPTDRVCDPIGGNGCACDVKTNECDIGCGCDTTCNVNCECDLLWQRCDVGCFCDLDCPGACPCNATPACVSACGCDGDCPCACDTTTKCDVGCACDPDCYYGCTCDTTTGCESGCTCDPECGSSCGCDLTSGCDTGCTCDPACAVTCTCDTSPTCETGCSCDTDCGNTCACDLSAGCDAGCVCDPVCAAGCACNLGPLCEAGCGCDPDCAGSCACDYVPGCDAGCGCDDECSAGCTCNLGGLCEAGCACDPDCAGFCVCNVDTLCSPNCACDEDCTTCACNLSVSCDAGCACDPKCSFNCTCDTTGACESGCTCDTDCTGACACDITGAECDSGCTCDLDCVCACDKDAGACEPADATGEGWSDCACDANCPCACDTNYDCTSDCACDYDCLVLVPSGCNATEERSGLYSTLIVALLLVRRRRSRRA